MKYLSAIVLLAALALSVPAQTVSVTAPTPPATTVLTPPTVTTTVSVPGTPMQIIPFAGNKMTTELLAPRMSVKGKPFSAEGVSESVQVLEDGNRIKRSNTTKMFRDGEGRFRRETVGSTGGTGFGYSTYDGVVSMYGFHGAITISDPVANMSYILNPQDKTAKSFMYKIAPGKNIALSSQTFPPAVKAEIEAKLKEAKEKAQDKDEKKIETRVEVKPTVIAVPGGISVASSGYVMTTGGLGWSFDKDAKTEDLGKKTIEGVECEGKRTVKTIPAGTIGNERDIEVTYERWYSAEIEMVVYSRHYDPRSGEQIYKLTNIIQGEPSRDLFTVPSDYKMIDSSTIKAGTLLKEAMKEKEKQQ